MPTQAANQFYLYTGATNYPGVHLPRETPVGFDERESYVDIRDGIEPAFARMWMTAAQFNATPSTFRQGTSALGIKMSGWANLYPPGGSRAMDNRTITFPEVFYLIRATVCRAALGTDTNSGEAVYEV